MLIVKGLLLIFRECKWRCDAATAHAPHLQSWHMHPVSTDNMSLTPAGM